MNAKRNFPWWGVVLGAGCACMLCVGGVLGVGGVSYFFQITSGPPTPEFVSTIPPDPTQQQPAVSPDIPGPTQSVDVEPTASAPSLTGSQELTEYRLYDDFSSEALGWPIFDDGKTIMKYEDGQYSVQIAKPDYVDWAFIPVDFNPLEIWFDIKGLAGTQNGTAGVFCQYQDPDNYYYVEFDLAEGSYVIGQYANGENIALTQENAQGQYWQETSTLNSTPGTVNRIGISCYQSVIAVFVNDEWVTEAAVQEPAGEPGEAAFFVYTYPFADAEGYKVYFDNVEVYEPVQ